MSQPAEMAVNHGPLGPVHDYLDWAAHRSASPFSVAWVPDAPDTSHWEVRGMHGLTVLYTKSALTALRTYNSLVAGWCDLPEGARA